MVLPECKFDPRNWDLRGQRTRAHFTEESWQWIKTGCNVLNTTKRRINLTWTASLNLIPSNVFTPYWSGLEKRIRRKFIPKLFTNRFVQKNKIVYSISTMSSELRISVQLTSDWLKRLFGYILLHNQKLREDVKGLRMTTEVPAN